MFIDQTTPETGLIGVKVNKSLVYEFNGDTYEWHKGLWRGSGEGNLSHGLMCGYIASGQAKEVVETGCGQGSESITSVPFEHKAGGIWEAVEYFHQIGSNGKQNVGAVCKRVDALTWVWTAYIFPGNGGANRIVLEQGSSRNRDECLDAAHWCWKKECEKR